MLIVNITLQKLTNLQSFILCDTRKVKIWFVIIIRYFFFIKQTVMIMMSVCGFTLSDGSLQGPILNFRFLRKIVPALSIQEISSKSSPVKMKQYCMEAKKRYLAEEQLQLLKIFTANLLLILLLNYRSHFTEQLARYCRRINAILCSCANSIISCFGDVCEEAF